MVLNKIILNGKFNSLLRNKVLIQQLKNSFFPDLFYLKSLRSFLWLFKGLVKGFSFKNQTLEIFVNAEDAYKLLYILKNSSNFNYNSLIDVFVCDRPGKKKRFIVTYHLLSLLKNNRIQVSIWVQELSFINSISSLFKSANWLEREIWDMYGLVFKFHPDLRRILTDYGFSGYPLRKDFPLSGFTELFYDFKQKQLVYEPVELAQEYRNFNFKSPWIDS